MGEAGVAKAMGLAVAVAVAAAGWFAAAPVAAASGGAGVRPGTLNLQPCRLPGLATEARCGTLLRPLDPSRPQGPSVEIHLAVLPAVARVPLPDPVLFLAGGPGQGAIDLAGPVQGLLGRLNNRRDLLLVDLRGTGRSAPLSCAFDAPEAARRPLAESFDLRLREEAVAACRATLARGPAGDLTAYGTTLAVQDLLAVLDAWGRERVNLVGGSYGTRVALEFARQAPDRVRRSVLDGVAPPDMQLPRSGAEDNRAALEALLRACEEDAPCAAAHPRVRAQLRSLLEAPPREVAVLHPVTGLPQRLMLERRTVLGLLRGPLYAPSLSAGLPAAIAAAADGHFEPLVGLAASAGSAPGAQLATGLHLSVVCSEDAAIPGEAPGSDPSRAAAASSGFEFDDPYPGLCRDWPRFVPPAGFRQMPAARHPVWLLSGGADPVTPPRHGQRAAAALGAQAVHSIVPAAGHGLLGLACIREAVARFIDEPDEDRARAGARAAGERCAAALPRPVFRVAPWGPVPSGPAAEGAGR